MVFAINVNIAWTQERYKKNLLFYGAKFFYLCWMVVYFYNWKLDKASPLKKLPNLKKWWGSLETPKKYWYINNVRLMLHMQFKLALQIYQTCDIILSVNYMSSRIK